MLFQFYFHEDFRQYFQDIAYTMHFYRRMYLWLIGLQIDFNGMLTYRWLFYICGKGNEYIVRLYLHKFIVSKVFCSLLYIKYFYQNEYCLWINDLHRSAWSMDGTLISIKTPG